MKFVAREDIGRPAGEVFAALSDYAAFERMALRRGADVARKPGKTPAWDVRFRLRGRMREVVLEVVRLDPPASIGIGGRSANLDMSLAAELLALSRTRTRLTIELDVRPRTLTARILLQPLKLARARALRRFRQRVHDLAVAIERGRWPPDQAARS